MSSVRFRSDKGIEKFSLDGVGLESHSPLPHLVWSFVERARPKLRPRV
jgi:hypothetical protein